MNPTNVLNGTVAAGGNTVNLFHQTSPEFLTS